RATAIDQAGYEWLSRYRTAIQPASPWRKTAPRLPTADSSSASDALLRIRVDSRSALLDELALPRNAQLTNTPRASVMANIAQRATRPTRLSKIRCILSPGETKQPPPRPHRPPRSPPRSSPTPRRPLRPARAR